MPELRLYSRLGTRMIEGMALYIRPLSESERVEIERGRRSENGPWFRRCHILRASSQGKRVPQIARDIGWHPESVRKIIRRFNAGGLDAVRPGKRTGRRPWETHLAEETIEAVLDLARGCPQQHEVDLPVWTADAIAEAAHKQGILDELVSAKCIRSLFARQGHSWKLVQAWQTSPDPDYAAKKERIERLVERFCERDEMELMYEDESWFSRHAMPRLRSYGPRGERTRIPIREASGDQTQKAVAVYGALTIPRKQVCIWCVDEQPRSETTWSFLKRLVDYARRNHRRWLVVIWDNAPFHKSQRLIQWIREHNRAQSDRSDAVRIVPYCLPTRSPWLNPIEPHWLHCKRAIYSVYTTPTPDQLKRQVRRYFQPKSPIGYQAS